MDKIKFLVITSIFLTGMLISPALGEQVLSPRKQMAMGVAAEDVKCKEGLELMIRSSGSAACVTSSTAVKLDEVGWGEVIQVSSEAETEVEVEEGMAIGEGPIEEEPAQVEIEEGMAIGEGPTEEKESPLTIGGIDISMAGQVEGSADAPITIIEFGDYQCPKCEQWFENVKPTITKDYIAKGKAKLYFVDFTFLGDDSVAAAQATYCAGDQGRYNDYHSILYTNQGAIESGWASNSALIEFATTLDLDVEMFSECLDSGKYSDRVSYNTQVGTANGVKATPTFFVISADGTIVKKIEGPQPSSAFDYTIYQVS